MSAILGRILGIIDGNIDLVAITGIFGRIAELVDEGQALAKEFRNDPRLTAYFAKVRNLLKLPSGEVITKEEIAALSKHWGDGGDEPVYDRPKKTPPPPPAPPPTGGRFTDYNKALSAAPDMSLLVAGDRVFVDRLDAPTLWFVWSPELGRPLPAGGWVLLQAI